MFPQRSKESVHESTLATLNLNLNSEPQPQAQPHPDLHPLGVVVVEIIAGSVSRVALGCMSWLLAAAGYIHVYYHSVNGSNVDVASQVN